MSGFVYAIRADNGLVKIGFSTDPDKRFASLRTANGASLERLCVVPATRQHEQHIHRRLKSSRVRGEWYKFDPAVCHCVESIKSQSWDAIGFENAEPAKASMYQLEAEKAADFIQRCSLLLDIVPEQAGQSHWGDISSALGLPDGALWKFLYRPAEPYSAEYFGLLNGVTKAVAKSRARLDEMEEFAASILDEHARSLSAIKASEARIAKALGGAGSDVVEPEGDAE